MTPTTTKLIVTNTVFVAGVISATIMGYTAFVFDGDSSRISYAIAAIVATGAVAAFWTGKHLTRAAWLCEVLGFVGTLVGITMGMSGGHDLSTIDGVIAAGNALYAGMGTAFCSTLVGAAGMLWLWSLAQVEGA